MRMRIGRSPPSQPPPLKGEGAFFSSPLEGGRSGGGWAATLLLTLSLLTTTACAQTAIGPRPQAVDDVLVPAPPGVRVESWVEGLEAPWSLVFLPDGSALVSERPGRIRAIRDGRLLPEPVASIEVENAGEGRLMGLALHPRFPAEPLLYAV